ncbi:5-amino-6-(D-ribitylamino)uracil--L-tyrosine 4-hydroxyphenyl transferase CofH [Methanosphaerula palustris]|uniref:Radical SAM domain protein n=1 Tax=Methanosphaerula palustris (strain ATCC BAA-1556 / DSM 19958 / E1-9c) TaxID=521011 RepID=B8GKA2_METPE|nr:5-amino-6-(D-ribitylamino)uracil--L-tyrosine 4-hydroxyphenyl transferase CofH [Methanosphaerula palustris]ACL15785.1 Radical SAM domain protein [Methanosphaerula palustris E1-9c]
MDTDVILHDVLAGRRLTEAEGLHLLSIRGREIFKVLAAADELREERVGEAVTYVRNQNLHVTNICKNLCGFCGFGRRSGDEGAYLNSIDVITENALLAKERGVTEVCFLSGVHPAFTLQSYMDMIGAVHAVILEADIHACSPEEVSFVAKKSGLSTAEVLDQLRAAGLGTLQGTAAEILVQEVRDVICPRKVPGAEWIRIIKEAHGMGIRSTATIMYGSCESARDRIRHLGMLREIQDETGGFTELVPMTYIHQNTPLFMAGKAPSGATGSEDLLLLAVSRLFLDNFDHIQVSWGKLGLKMTQIGLLSGGDDLGGTMYVDDVTVDAGAKEAAYLDPTEMGRICKDLGRPLIERNTVYQPVHRTS